MVEGPDDQWTIINLLARHGYDWNNAAALRPYVEPVGGVEKLLARATPFGTALASEVLGHDSPEAQRFVGWFRQCFT
jgi:hypothetical protein